MPSQRSYKTNLAFEATLVSLTKKYNIPDAIKGHATFRIPEFPKIPVQITTQGFVLILGRKAELDEQILKIITPNVTTQDSQQFNWELHKQTKGEKELLEDFDLEAQRRLLTLFLGILEYELIPFDGFSHEEVNKARELLATLPPKVDNMDSKLISQYISEVRDSISNIEHLKEALGPSTWYDGT